MDLSGLSLSQAVDSITRRNAVSGRGIRPRVACQYFSRQYSTLASYLPVSLPIEQYIAKLKAPTTLRLVACSQ